MRANDRSPGLHQVGRDGRLRQRRAGGVVAVVELAVLACLALLLLGETSGEGELTGEAFFWLNVPVEGALVPAVLLGVLAAALERRKRAALLTLVLFQLVGLAVDAVWATALTVAPSDVLDPGANAVNALWLTAGHAVVAVGIVVLLWLLRPALPPTGGLGMGVDRLLMMLTGGSIRQTVLFPFTRAKPARR